MKKNFKTLVASLIAILGVGVSFGTAFALYQGTTAKEIGFEIGTYSYTPVTGDLTYKVGTITNDLGTDKISPNHKTMKVFAPLGGIYPTEGVPAQDYIYGNLSVKATIAEELVGKVRWAVYMQGYKAGSHWANTVALNTLTTKVDDADPLLASSETTVAKNVAVTAVSNPTIPTEEEGEYANQWVEIFLNFDGLVAGASFLDLAEKTFKIEITWGAVDSSAIVPLIMGDGNTWTKSDEYRMVPNIKANTFEWGFKGITGFSKMKIVEPLAAGDRWIGCKIDGQKDEDGNLLLTSTETYSCYWSSSDYIKLGQNNTIVND